MIFETTTSLGMKVALSEGRWRVICEKHPDMAGREREVLAVLEHPDFVRHSRTDPLGYLYYGPLSHGLRVCVVLKYAPGDTVEPATCYRTNRVKEGPPAR